jgi:hypothetical protein
MLAMIFFAPVLFHDFRNEAKGIAESKIKLTSQYVVVILPTASSFNTTYALPEVWDIR